MTRRVLAPDSPGFSWNLQALTFPDDPNLSPSGIPEVNYNMNVAKLAMRF